MRFLVLAALIGLATAATVTFTRNPDGSISHEVNSKPFVPVETPTLELPIAPPSLHLPIAPPSIELPSIEAPIEAPIYTYPEYPQQNLPVIPNPEYPQQNLPVYPQPEPEPEFEREIVLAIDPHQAVQRVVLNLISIDENEMKMTPY